MFSGNSRPHFSDFDGPESNLRFGMMVADLWHDWFEAISEVAYQTHRACEFFMENGGPLNERYERFDFRRSFKSSEAPHDSIDMEKLKECLQSMEPTQAARVIHAVQMMQAMDAMLRRRRSRTRETEGNPW
jgi:replicative superfamily II helicase